MSDKKFSEQILKKIPLPQDTYKLHLSDIDHSNKVEYSGVLVIIYYDQQNVPIVIFTKRSTKLRNHAGEISFPGGRMSVRDDSLVDTAIRETFEEIGLRVSKENIFGCLTPTNTYTTKILIFPFVVIMTGGVNNLVPNEEVEEIIEIPLEKLLNSVEIDKDHSSSDYQMFKFVIEEHLIWGATARILKNLLEIIETKKNSNVTD
ncbi:MAG TPA: CoA pyrophosphatase [Candidatus Nitrosocosmicus sp.]|nr:CoA pyrophosphatase [Candidatus Nitrosocosmicus sp.]